MYAIVDIAGKQFKVEKDSRLFVPRLDAAVGDHVTFDRVLLVADGKKVTVGTPAVKGYAVKATVVDHVKGDKLIVFKKKRRKGYRVKRGHRQPFTQLSIDSLKARASAKKAG
jgi:large subunit ribosomal protein L21